MAKIGSQLGGGGAATLEKVGMDLSQQVQQVSSAKRADPPRAAGTWAVGIKNGGGGGDGDGERSMTITTRATTRCV